MCNSYKFSSSTTNGPQKYLFCALNLIVLVNLGASLASTSDVQPPNQAPNVPSPTEAQAPLAGSLSQLQKLPNINIYINKNEIRKLLGIDTRINYVTNGNIDTYPFGFTIPLGYNQSDMIFTWQNLGQTNVNYSISLIIGNREAVDAPLINITRSGLIPMHEQVFKITLPCSGKVTDEVDVQVLFNITGFVASSASSIATNSDDEQQQSAHYLGQSEQNGTEQGTNSTLEPMQSDQANNEPVKQRLVSHKLAIKRKKICTMHPVPVQPRISGQFLQPPTRNQFQEPSNSNRWPQPLPQENFAQQSILSKSLAASQDSTTTPTTTTTTTEQTFTPSPILDPLELSTRKLKQLNLIPAHRTATTSAFGEHNSPDFQYPNWHQKGRAPAPPPPRAIPAENPLNDILAHQRQFSSTSSMEQPNANNNSPLVLTLIALSLLISVALIVVAILGSSSSNQSPFDKLASLTSCILRRTPASNKCKSPSTIIPNNVIGSLRVGGPKSANSVASSLSGLSAISGLHHHHHHHQQQQQNSKPAYCYKTNCAGFFTNSTGNQYNSNGHHTHYQHPPTADLLGTGYQCAQSVTQQSQQQLPPPPPPQYPIYHIATGNNSQTTRLIWNNGNGTNSDGFTIDGGSYMPLSNAPRSDSGSVYQTIY